jgi:hypothetical protein
MDQGRFDDQRFARVGPGKTRRWILPPTAIVVSAGLIPAMMWVSSPRFPIARRRPVDRSLIA